MRDLGEMRDAHAFARALVFSPSQTPCQPRGSRVTVALKEKYNYYFVSETKYMYLKCTAAVLRCSKKG